MRARLARIAKLIEEKGLERLGEPHLKHVQGRLWEMRLKGRAGISRALYVTGGGRRVVVVRVFIKKTEETARRAIELALARAKSGGRWGYGNGAESRPPQEMDER